MQRSVRASSKGGELLVPLVDGWARDKQPGDWLFEAPHGGPLGESNWKRSVAWSAATKAIGRPTFRVHDLRHTCASLWLGAGADPKNDKTPGEEHDL